MQSSSSFATPAISSQQMTSGKGDAASKTVNLFRGDVNLSIPLVSLSGKNGLDLHLNAFYQSNVSQQIQLRNFEAPTGVLGLGWSFSFATIKVVTKNSGDQSTHDYVYSDQGTQNRLIKSNRRWQKGVLGMKMISYLDDEDLSTELLNSFLNQSLRLSSKATIKVIKKGQSWQITDTIFEGLFNIENETPNSSELIIYDAGEAFELENYEFWHIRYYANFLKWEITKSNGNTFVFGGGVTADNNGISSCNGNSIQWGVKWNNWIGPSTKAMETTSGKRLQQQYPLIFGHASTYSPWMDEIEFSYAQTLQKVGEKGLPYTKACYLEKIVDAFGRIVVFKYKDKVFDRSNPLTPREYLDPYKEIPDENGNAYQTRYETLYLDQITVSSKDAHLLFTIQFKYPAKELLQSYANIGNLADPYLRGSTVKRTLLGISKIMPDGCSLPGTLFSYYQKSGDNHAGALQQVIYPDGAVVSYNYKKTALPNCKRSLSINPPIVNGTPRVWFGKDYAVVTWNDNNGMIYISIYTWIGYWHQWHSTPPTINPNISPDDLEVIIEEDFCALHYMGTKTQGPFYLRVYHKDERTLGQWREYDPIRVNSSEVEVTSGKNFLMYNNFGTNELNLFNWNIYQKIWEEDKTTIFNQSICATINAHQFRYFIKAQDDSLVVLCYDIRNARGAKKSQLNLFRKASNGEWSLTGSYDAKNIALAEPTNDYFDLQIAPAFILATYTTQDNYNQRLYTIDIITWGVANQNSQLSLDFSKNLTIDKSDGRMLLPYLPSISDNGLITSGPFMFRYNGSEWLYNDNLNFGLEIDEGDIFWLAHGDDYLVKSQIGKANYKGQVQVFDPAKDSEVWSSKSMLLGDGTSGSDRFTKYFASAGKDFFTWNTNLYARGTSTDWKNAVAHPLYDLIQFEPNLHTTTIINEGPEFLTYLITSNDGKAIGTNLLIVKNGSIDKTSQLPTNFFQVVGSDGHFVKNLNGKFPAGQSTFLTFLPLSDTFDNAQSIQLHRFLGNSLDENINSYPVDFIEIGDGYEKVYHCYTFDPNTAICDPSGRIAKFYNSAHYAGCASPNLQKNGFTTYAYYNGYPKSQTLPISVHNPTSALDGILLERASYDRSKLLVASVKKELESVFSIKTSPTQSELTKIAGVYINLISKTSMKDGISHIAHFTQDLYSGNVISSKTDIYNAKGEIETHMEETLYGHMVYPWSSFLHQINLKVQINKTIAIQAGDPIIVSSEVNTWDAYSTQINDLIMNVPANHKTYFWQGGALEAKFDFDQWSGANEPPAVWIKTSEVTGRSKFGLVTTRTDPNNRTTSNLLDPLGELSIASFSNADIEKEEAYYFGFEPYETSGKWKIDLNTTPIVNVCSYTGSRSLAIPAGKKSTPLTLSPYATDKAYYLGCWMRGSSDVLQHAGWKIQVGQEAAEYIILTQSDDWQYYFKTIQISTAATTVTMTLFNESSSEIFIDNIVFCTKDGQFFANVYESNNNLITAEIGPYNQIQRWIYDDYLHPVAKVGTEERIRSCNVYFLSRQTKNNQFDTAFPNHNITCHPSGATFYSRFYNNGKWDNIWTPDKIANWKNECGVLSHLSQEDGSIFLNEVYKTKAIFLYLNVRVGDTSKGRVGIAIRNGLEVAFDLSTQTWAYSQVAGSLSEKAAYSTAGKSWLFINMPNAFLFLVDGVIVFNKLLDTAITGQLSLTASTDVSFLNILGGEDPQVGGMFYDGGFKLRQSQAMIETCVIANQLLYNQLGHKSITTKSIEQKCTSSIPLLTYNPNLVKSMDWNTGIMTGVISDGYPDDDGYPYTRTLHEASPLARTIEKGEPGKIYAITNLDTSTPEQRHTDKFYYKANGVDFSKKLNLPQGQYYKLVHMDADNNTSLQLSDKLGQSIAAGSAIPNTGGEYITSLVHRDYTLNGSTLTLYLPNYFDPPIGSQPEAWTRVSHFDLVGRVVKMNLPNQGESQKIFNRTGLTRFLINPQLKANGLVAYVKYDDLERIIERGVFPSSLTMEELTVKAVEDESWPGEAQKTRPYEAMFYDGDCTDINQLGLLCRAIISSKESALSSIQTEYKYDAFGRVINKIDHSDAYEGQTFSTGYAYDNLDQVIAVSYPSGRQINYNIDQIGRTKSICDKEGKVLAKYEYYPEGQIRKEDLTLENGSFERAYGYNAPGWLASIADKLMRQSLQYGDSKSQYPTYNGKISSQEIDFSIQQTEAFPANVKYQYLYDHIGQLKSAIASQGGNILHTASVGTPKVITYDASGNLLQVDVNGSTNRYQYDKNKDFVSKTSEGTFQSNLLGAVKNTSGKKITDIVYDDIHQLPLKVTTEENGVVEMAYDDAARRAIKCAITGKKIYLYGTGDLPLSETIVATGGVRQEIDYIFGPSGMIGLFEGNEQRWILKDHINSTRIIMSGQGNVLSAYHYLPFGDQWVPSLGPKNNMAYLFTAYEYDKETGLYNAGARLYDPALRRFYSVDPKLQYASPYIYSNNNPILVTDPNGESAGMDAAMGVSALLITVGIIGAIFSFGATLSIAAAGAGEAAATGLGAGLDVGLEGGMAGTDGAVAAADSGIGTKLGLAAVNVASSVALGSGMSGAHYTETHTQYNGAAFGSALGAGAAGGFVSGLAGAVLTPLADAVITPILTQGTASAFIGATALGAVRGFVIGGTTSVLGKLTSNAVSGKKVDSGLLGAFLAGASVGGSLDIGTTGTLSGVLGKFNLAQDAKFLNSLFNVPKTLVRRGIVGEINLHKSGPPPTAVNKGHFNSKANKISHVKSNSPISHPVHQNNKTTSTQSLMSASSTMASHHQVHSLHPQASMLDRLDVGLNGDTLQPGQRRSNLSKQEYCRPARYYIS